MNSIADYSYLSEIDTWLAVCRKDLTDDELAVLRRFIVEDLPTVDARIVNEAYFKGLKHRFFPKDYWQNLTKTKRAPVVKAVFSAAVIREFVLRFISSNPYGLVQNQDYFNSLFPEFQGAIDQAEAIYLPRYYMAICTTVQFVQGYYNKYLFLKIGSLLEGSGLVYTTGGAPSPSTKRRIAIYERICDVTAMPRTASSNKRSRDEDDDEELSSSSPPPAKKQVVSVKREKVAPQLPQQPACTIVSEQDALDMDLDFGLDFEADMSTLGAQAIPYSNATCMVEDNETPSYNTNYPLNIAPAVPDIEWDVLQELF